MPIWQLCANLLIPNCLRSNLSYSPLAALELNVNMYKSIKAILGNLKAIAQGVAELRNLYGSGHGKSSSYKGLESRHASLAIGSSTTLVRFLWDSYERHHNNEVN